MLDIKDIKNLDGEDLLATYKGNNPYIKYMKKKIETEKKYFLTNNQSKYVKKYLHFEPKLPKKWSRLIFNLRWRNAVLRIVIKQNDFNISNIKGDSVDFFVSEKEISLKNGENYNSNTIL